MKARNKAIDAAKVICREAGIHFNSEIATKILDVLESERKQQDRDTRHACAEAIINIEGEITKDIAHNACMNVQAV